MRTHLLIVALLAFSSLPERISAQTFAIDWYTVDGGGGTSAGGIFTVSGTIGQPDAGTLTGGNYTLTGGFWAIIAAVQMPSAPVLTITRSGANIILSWPSPSVGFGLQENPSLVPTDWMGVDQAASDNGNVKSVTLPGNMGTRFFRLKR